MSGNCLSVYCAAMSLLLILLTVCRLPALYVSSQVADLFVCQMLLKILLSHCCSCNLQWYA